MSDDATLPDDYEIDRFLRVAQATISNPSTPGEVREIIQRCVKNVLLNLQWMSTEDAT